MKFKRLMATLLVLTSVISLVGCGDNSEISELNGLTALNAESNVKDDYHLSYSEEQELIYAQVSNRQLLDLSTLVACTDNEVNQVLNYMETVDSQLVGDIPTASYNDSVSKYFLSDMIADDSVIDSYFTDYLLTVMQQTPYYWQRAKTVIRGMDASSRSIIVDVTYKTINFEKDIKANSTICLGTPNYENMMANRYNKYIEILTLQQNLGYGNQDAAEQLEKLRNDFIKYYGDPNDIIKEQNSLSPTGTIFVTGNQLTYNGLIDSDAEQSGGSLTVRYVLVPNYVLGINLGITCKHMYITEYTLDRDYTKDLEIFNQEGYTTVTDSVYNLIYSYFTCMDESDFSGLYSLTNNFNKVDKYYENLFNSAYMKHDGFSVSLFNITGTRITCGVTISTKERAKSTEMTFPVYTDRYFMELELVGDKLKVDNLVLLSRRIEGEPAISSDDADTSGFSAIVELDNADKADIEKLICNFSAIQLLGDTSSDKFSEIVDISTSTNHLSALQSNMTLISGDKKVVFLQNYQQGTSNYASVKCKELYQNEKKEIVEAEVVYEFILKGGKWYVYNYHVNSSIRLDTTNLVTTNSLCLVTPGKVESYTSQIKGQVTTDLDNITDTSVTIEHQSYMPDKRDQYIIDSNKQLSSSDINEEIFNSVVINIQQDMSFSQFLTDIQTLDKEASITGDESLTGLSSTCKWYVLDMVAVVYNKNTNRYSAEELDAKLELARTNADTYISKLSTLANNLSGSAKEALEREIQLISNLRLAL